MTSKLLLNMSLFAIFRSFKIQVILLQNINLCSRIVRSRLSLYFLKNVHISKCSCVSLSPVVQCLQCILSSHWDDLFPFILSSILHRYLNHSLASARQFLSIFFDGISIFRTLSHLSGFSLKSSDLAFPGSGSDPMVTHRMISLLHHSLHSFSKSSPAYVFCPAIRSL